MNTTLNGIALTRATGVQVARVLRLFRAPVVIWLAYRCSELVFCYLSRRNGLLQGVSVVNLGTLVFGVWSLALRFAVLFYVPLAVVYRVSQRLWSLTRAR